MSKSQADFLSIANLANDRMQHVFQQLAAIEKADFSLDRFNPTLFQGSVMAPLFETPSIRSKSGFCSAFLKLGGAVLDIERIERRLFDGQGQERAEQIVSYLSVYCDVIVFRCHQKLLADVIVDHFEAPVISAGISGGEHPVTGLAHLYSIQRDTSRLSDHNVLFISSCNSTSIASIFCGLSKFSGNTFSILTSDTQPSLNDKNNLIRYDPNEIALHDLDLSKFTLILIDESERASLPPNIIDRMRFGIEEFRSATSLERIAHIKPVLELLDSAMKERLAGDCLLQSKLSYLTKFLIFEEVLKKYKAN